MPLPHQLPGSFEIARQQCRREGASGERLCGPERDAVQSRQGLALPRGPRLQRRNTTTLNRPHIVRNRDPDRRATDMVVGICGKEQRTHWARRPGEHMPFRTLPDSGSVYPA